MYGLSKDLFLNKILPLIFILMTASINLAFADDSACSYFFPKLSELPHTKLKQNNNRFKSLWNGKWTNGCEIVFKSHDSIVSGDKVYDTFQSFINSPGWVLDNNLSADGSGSSSVGIENEKSRCAILWSQHSWIDKNTGQHKKRVKEMSSIKFEKLKRVLNEYVKPRWDGEIGNYCLR